MGILEDLDKKKKKFADDFIDLVGTRSTEFANFAEEILDKKSTEVATFLHHQTSEILKFAENMIEEKTTELGIFVERQTTEMFQVIQKLVDENLEKASEFAEQIYSILFKILVGFGFFVAIILGGIILLCFGPTLFTFLPRLFGRSELQQHKNSNIESIEIEESKT